MPPYSLAKTHPLTSIINSSLVNLPTPSSITFNWNYGSLMGATLLIQTISGLILSFHFTPDSTLAFQSLHLMTRNINALWSIQYIHANGASIFFFLIYLHIARNIYYSTKNTETWLSGVSLLLILSATAFLGYVLPWGQMSFWGASVITNLLSAVPYIGHDIVNWLWGGFSISNPTLKRFFSLHFLLPFILFALAIVHLMYLHETGSSNPLGLQNKDKTTFHPFFSMKDLMGLLSLILMMLLTILYSPLIFNDPENFNQANSSTTPIHIQPEWYFLFAYAILRSIPNKLGGVIALLTSILILTLPLAFPKTSLKFTPANKTMFLIFINSSLILTWIGANPVEDPFILIGQAFSFLYFLSFLLTLSLPSMTHHSKLKTKNKNP